MTYDQLLRKYAQEYITLPYGLKDMIRRSDTLFLSERFKRSYGAVEIDYDNEVDYLLGQDE